MLSAILAAIFPERCPSCHALTVALGLCDRCAETLYPTAPTCPACGNPGAAASVCARCRRRPPPWRSMRSSWLYGGELAIAVRRFKWGARGNAGRPELARPLGQLLVTALLEAATAADVIVPVPLHAGRVRERGFSQALLLAAAARRLGKIDVPLAPAILERTRPTLVQAGLGRRARERNVAGAFAVPRPERVRGLRVVLVDDVVTTGATVAACARALRAAGAVDIQVAALARAEL